MSKWEKVRLDRIGMIYTGNTPPTSNELNYSSFDIPFIKPNNLDGNSLKSIDHFTSYISEHARPLARLVPMNSVLVSCIGTIGKVAIVKQEVAFNQQINAIIPNSEIINEKYLGYSILSIRNLLNKKANSAVVAIINKSKFSNFEISLPPIEVQEEIAQHLDTVSELLVLRKKQLEELDLLIKSQFVAMFGDPVTNPMGWDKQPFREFIQFITSGSRGWSGYFSDDGEIFLTIKNVKNCSISTENIQYVNAPTTNEAKRTRVKEGDLLISITADLGRTGVVNSDIAEFGAYINQHLSLVRLDIKRLNPYFVSHYLETEAGRRQFEKKNQVGVKSGLNFESIKSLIIIVPPIEKQMRYINFVRQVEEQKTLVKQSIAEAQQLFDALMSIYFDD